MAKPLSRAIIWAVVALFAYDAYGHIASIAGMHGYSWLEAPVKWRLMDVFFLTLDIIAITGLILRWSIGLVAGFVSATCQLLLFTVFRSWVVDVPVNFAEANDRSAYLDLMVGLYLAAIASMLFVFRAGGLKRRAQDG
jgi:hypothetical protein